MTANEEYILSSRALLKKGLAVERFMQNLIVDKKIKTDSLLVGDRNAILIAARISGYGSDYETHINCPSCGEKTTCNFDLLKQTVKETDVTGDDEISALGDGTFEITMPYSKFKVVFKLLTGSDETYLTQLSVNKRKTRMSESVLTDQYKRMIISIEGHRDSSVIKKYVNAMPTMDSRHLRSCYNRVTPDVSVNEPFECLSCGHEQEMEVPFGADFFWPDR